MSSHWIAEEDGWTKWNNAECKHEKIKSFKNSVRDKRTCLICKMSVELVKVYGRVGDRDGNNGTSD